MPIRVRCPACEHAFKADRKFEGKRARCPKCGAPLRIVDYRAAAAPTPAAHKRDDEESGTTRVLGEEPTKRRSSDDTKKLQARRLEGTPTGDEPNLISVFDNPASHANPPTAGHGVAPAAGAAADHGVQPVSPDDTQAPAIHVGDPRVGGAAARIASRSKRRQGLSPIVLVGVIGVALLFVAGVGGGAGVYFLLSPGAATEDQRAAADRDKVNTPETNTEDGGEVETPAQPELAGSDATDDSTDNEAHSPADNSDVAAKLSQIASRSIAKLHVRKPSGETTGSAFFVSSDGWLATSHHLIDGAFEVGVELDGMIGATIESDGIVRVDRRHDLALISVHPDRRFNVLPLRRTPSPSSGAPQFTGALPAWGDQWVSDCRLLGRKSTSQLPRDLIARFGSGALDADMVWLEVDGKLSPDGEGGPILDPGGEVNGLCLAIDAPHRRGYAADVQHLVALLDAANSSEPNLIPYGGPPPSVAASTGSDDPPIKLPATSTTEPTSPQPPESAAAAEQFTRQLIDKLAELNSKCAAAEWLPNTQQQYADFQELALELTRAAAIAEDARVPENLRARIGDAIAQSLTPELQWENTPRLEAVNRFAAAGMDGPEPRVDGSEPRGVYAIGEVVARPGQITLGDQPAVGLQLIGTKEIVFTPIRFHADQLQPESRWLILGVFRARIDVPSDAADARRCSLIDARYVVDFPKDASDAP